MSRVFHPSLELGQHGGKGLTGALDFAKRAGCVGAQPSNYLLQGSNGDLMSPDEVRAAFAQNDLLCDGISSHCMFWVHGTAWTGSATIRPFIPEHLHQKSVQEIERWVESYLIRLMELASELNRKVIPMFWGLYQGYELATGYPWGFPQGPGYDLVKLAEERFVTKTQRLRDEARSLGLVLAHEIHPNSGAMCADDFLRLRQITDNDPSLGVFADPSHCWNGETFEERFIKVGPYVYGAHAKDFKRVPGLPQLSQQMNWQRRGVYFTRLGTGEVDLCRYAEILISSGIKQRLNALHDTSGATVPMCAEAESPFVDLDECAADGVRYVKDHLCFEVMQGSFEDGMGN